MDLGNHLTVPSWCARYVGLPYKPGGRTRDGLDCWGLCSLIWAEEFGRPIPEYDGPFWRPGASAEEVAKAAEAFAARFTPVPFGEERCGDGIMLRMRGAVMHIGMVIIPGTMLHIEAKADACLESYRSTIWAPRATAIYRYE